MEQSQEHAESETADDTENKGKIDFCVNVAAIESVSREQQACELQSLELEVFDHATLEKGIIAQVHEAIQSTVPPKGEIHDNDPSKEDGELDDEAEEEDEFARKLRLGEVTPFDQSEEGKSLQERSKNGFNEAMQRYMENQARLQKSRNLKSGEESPKKPQPPKQLPSKRKAKGPKEFVPAVEEAKKEKKPKAKSEKKGKFLGTKKRKKSKKEKLGTKKSRGPPRSDTAVQPGEEATINLDHSSGSEYLPSDSEDSDDGQQKKSRKPLRALMAEVDTDYSESDWESSDDEAAKKRRSNKELDDGDPHYFTKRVKGINHLDYTKELHIVLDEFKCPKVVWDKLYKYQQVAVKWFWELNQQRCGGILGDEMGLGKTIQVIAFLAGLYASDISDYDTGHSGLGPSLIVCPTTVMHQWVREFHKWFPIIRVAILHESGTFTNTGKEKSRLIDSIHSHDYGVLITSYSGLVQHSKKILDKQWHYVILDEGHKIRNHQAQVTVVAKQLETPHRLILSGSPLQNNLKELWSLFDFIYPGKLGTLQVFTNVFHLPIVAGGYTNASPAQVMQAFKCALTLKDTITPYLLRRMKRDVNAHIKLPPKTEQVLFCKLTEDQREMYQHYLSTVSIEDMVRGNARIFVGLINLRKICNHPDLYSGGPRRNFTINDGEENSDEDRFGYWERAGKMIVVRTLLKIWNQQNHRVLLFTQTQKMLLILEDFVKRCGYNYLKLDGSTSVSARQPLIDKFNKDTSYFVMLLTTKVGGLGVNLTGANRVVIYDPDWNPATDTQARERAWRIGQEKDVTVYRLVTAGTIEEKIYHRQIFKQFLSNKVLKDPKQRRFFKSNDLSELFTLSETVKDGTNETAAIFAGTGSEVKPSKLSIKSKKPKYSAQESAQDPKITFSESKIEQMKKLAQLLSKKISNKVTETPQKNECEEPIAGCSKAVDAETKKDETANSAEKYSANGNGEVTESPQKNECGEPKAGCSKAVDADIKKDETSTSAEKSPANRNGEVVDTQDIYGPDGQIVLDSVQKLKRLHTCPSDGEPPADDPSTESSLPDTKTVSKMETDENDNHTRNSRRKRSASSSSNEPSPHKKKHKDSKRGTFEGHHVPHLVKCRKVKQDRDSEEKEAAAVSQDDYVLHKLFSKSGIETALRHDTIMEGGPQDYAIIEAEADRVAQEAIKALKESSAGVAVVRKPLFKPSAQGSSLLSAIKKRNMVVDTSDAENELVKSLVTFLNSKGGIASTDKIIEHFSERVGPGKSPLFKSLLGKIAKFHRGSDKVGYWTIQDEFKI